LCPVVILCAYLFIICDKFYNYVNISNGMLIIHRRIGRDLVGSGRGLIEEGSCDWSGRTAINTTHDDENRRHQSGLPLTVYRFETSTGEETSESLPVPQPGLFVSPSDKWRIAAKT
jgi:hypothetical protein